MNRRSSIIITFVLLMACAAEAWGQRRFVVADIETSAPIPGVNVVCSAGTLTTDSVGRLAVPDTCRTLVCSHVSYESRIVNVDELQRDTVYMISKLLSLEVVVFGKAARDDQYDELRRRLRMERTELELLQAKPGQGANLLGLVRYLLPKKWRKPSKKERLERYRQWLDTY